MTINKQRKKHDFIVNNLWTSWTLEKAIYEMLCGDEPAYSTTEVADNLKAPYSVVRNILMRMRRGGAVRSKTLGTRNNQTIWWIEGIKANDK